MTERLRLRVWRQLYLFPVLLWILTGILLVVFLRDLAARPIRTRQAADLRSDAQLLHATLTRDASGTGAGLVDLLFTHPRASDRLILADSKGRILADTRRDSSLWLVRPGRVIAGSVGWTMRAATGGGASGRGASAEDGDGAKAGRPNARGTDASGADAGGADTGGADAGGRDAGGRDARTEFKIASEASSFRDFRVRAEMAGRGADGDLRLLWVRTVDQFDSRTRRETTALGLAWIGFAVLFALFGWRSAGRIVQTFGGLRREIRRMDPSDDAAPSTSAADPPLAAGSTGSDSRSLEVEDPLDLASDLELVRQRVQRELSEGRLENLQREAVFEGMAEGLVALDPSLRILLMNRAASRMLSTGDDTLVGARLPEAIRQSALYQYVEDLASPSVPPMPEHVSPEHATREHPPLDLELEGGRRRVLVRGTVLRGADTHPRGFVLVLTDVTDVRRLEQIRKDFVENVSHELKTPLTTLRGYVETLLDGAHEEEKTRLSFLRTIHNNVDRMHRIVEDLLSLSRIESQGRQAERQPVRIEELAARVMEELRPEAEHRQVRLTLKADAGNERFSGNAFMLERALGNLVDNAIKYGGHGKDVEIRCLRRADSLVLEVADHGPGIPAFHLGRLFERFYRVDRGRSRELGGTGLGLAIVKHVAMAHGGEALVDSVLGQGSTFTIQLPWVKG